MEKKKKEMDVVTKMAIMGGAGLVLIVIFIGLISLLLKGDSKKEDPETATPTGQEAQETPEAQESNTEGFIDTMAVIQRVAADDETLYAYDIENDEALTLKVDGAVDLKDAYGTLMALGQFKAGEIVDVSYDGETMRPEHVYVSAQVMERDNVSNVTVDSAGKTIQIGNDIYRYTDELVTNYLGEPFDAATIDPVDEVSVVGYKDTIWSITLEKTHGFVILANQDKFLGGTMEVGKKTIGVTEEMKITVPVGVHDVVIMKDGMQSFVTQILVEEGKEVTIDMGEAQAESGMVSFSIQPSGAKLTINGVEYPDYSSPIPLDYGVYTVRVESEDYVAYESQISLKEDLMTVKISLEQNPMFLHVDNPVGTSLYIDGNYIGEIPVNTPIDGGSHTITLRKDGYYSKMHTVQIEESGKDFYYTFPDLIQMPADVTEEPTAAPDVTVTP